VSDGGQLSRPGGEVDRPGRGASEQDVRVEQWQVEQWQFQSPLLPPSVLAQYEELIPDFAERYMRSWEVQGEHRRRLESTVVATNSRTQTRGQTFAFVLGALTLLVAGALGVSDHEGAAIAVVGIDFAGLGGAFLVTKRRQDRELADKAAAVPEEPPSPRPSLTPPKNRPTKNAQRSKRKKRR
jgi:uncharacterized membrane protein